MLIRDTRISNRKKITPYFFHFLAAVIVKKCLLYVPTPLSSCFLPITWYVDIYQSYIVRIMTQE